MTSKIIIAPGAFKDSLSANAVASAIQHGLRRAGITSDLLLLPIADGGNGTLDAFLAGGGQRHSRSVQGPRGQQIKADFGLLADGRTAVIEMALASGLELLAADARDPLLTSTAGGATVAIASPTLAAVRPPASSQGRVIGGIRDQVKVAPVPPRALACHASKRNARAATCSASCAATSTSGRMLTARR